MKEVDGLYIHFPFCRHLCNYCDFYKHKLNEAEQVKVFEKLLLEQIEENKKLLIKNSFEIPSLKTLYIGGGTPSLWSKRGSEFLRDHLLDHINLKSDYEFTIEIDPGTWTKEEIESWIAIGVNRFSIGVQSFNDEYLGVLDRAHRKSEVIETIRYLKKIKANYSVDLMLGLPKLNGDRDILLEIEELTYYEPNHFSVYILKCRKNYPHYHLLPDDDEVATEYLETCEYLKSKGFDQYEVSNFAKAGRKSQHNIKYWRYESVAAIGPNSAGLLVKNDDHALRYKWKTQSARIEIEKLEGTSLFIEKLYMQLRAKGCFDRNIFDGKNYMIFKKLTKKWSELGYLKSFENDFELTSNGYLMLDSLMDDIFGHLDL